MSIRGGAVVYVARTNETAEALDWDGISDTDIKKFIPNDKIYVSTLKNPLIASFYEKYKDVFSFEQLSLTNSQEIFQGNADGIICLKNMRKIILFSLKPIL